MNDWKTIIETLASGIEGPGTPERNRIFNDLSRAVADHIEASGTEKAKLVFDEFLQNPDVWKKPLLLCLRESGGMAGGELARLAKEIDEAKPDETSRAPDFGIRAEKIEGAVQAERIGNLTQQYIAESSVVIAENGSTVFFGSIPEIKVEDKGPAMTKYLEHMIGRNRFLQLQGIRSGGRLVHIELERIYITLRTNPDRDSCEEEAWLASQAETAPGESLRREQACERQPESVSVSVEEALARHDRLVVLGDPGSGKTTLLRYLSLLYAEDMATGGGKVREKLELDESGRLPIYIPLGQIGRYVEAHAIDRDGTAGHGVLIDFLVKSLKEDRIDLDENFFDPWLAEGKAAVFLDGLDEVADPKLRGTVSRLVESFVRGNPRCRYAVTSRIVGYKGTARLGEGFKITTIRDFSMKDVESFLGNWHLLAEYGKGDAGEEARNRAARQTRRLLDAIEANERIRELAINPLMLTVIALVHRDRVSLPDRRAELYAEAVDVLLGKWDEAKDVGEISVLGKKKFDAGDKRLVLQGVAMAMHRSNQKEISSEELRKHLESAFSDFIKEKEEIREAAERFIRVIEERTGLLAARGQGAYSFSHLTFQEYLAALSIAEREDYIPFTLRCAQMRWWREVILLEAGYLGTQGKKRVSRLIRAIADLKEEPEPFHNLVLAAECLKDAGDSRVEGNLKRDVMVRLRKGVEKPPPLIAKWTRRFGAKEWIEYRSAAMDALVRIGAGFWSMPYGEPEWVEIPAGEFVMGEGKERKVHLDAYAISKVPVSNAQYLLFVKDVGYEQPGHWTDGKPPKNIESHPVVNVSWFDAAEYCNWLGHKTGRKIGLPTEAQWERAARGIDGRIFPWGNKWDPLKCNSAELGIVNTTPAGIFPEGASPEGALDMMGNVWEWCFDWYGPFQDHFARDPKGSKDEARWTYRGGSFGYWSFFGRSALRLSGGPAFRHLHLGFRLARS